MAVAAEAIKPHKETFDWTAAEEQVAYDDRSPDREVYGRSLSTIYNLGKVATKLAEKAAQSPEADQVRVEFYTSVEEGFGTDMKLGGGLEVRDFDRRAVVDDCVMAKDLKTAVSRMTYDGLICAEKTAQGDLRFLPQLTRSKWDHENALIVDDMSAGRTSYNTRIVVSPFPEEAAAQSGNEYWRGIGYVPHLRRGFVQLYHSNGSELVSGSLSFDGSSKDRLRDVFARHDIQIPEDEVTDNWLQYAITDTLTEAQAKALATEIADLAGDPAYKKTTNTVEITHRNRSIMDTVFNESYIHACESLARGYQTKEARKLIMQFADKARSFNERYADALYRMRVNESRFTDDDMVVVHELLVYSAIEMMRALHLDNKVTGQDDDSYRVSGFSAGYIQTLDAQSFQNAMTIYAADGAANNRVYSACGLSISLGDGRNGSVQEAFSGVDGKQEWFGRYKMKGTCVNCNEGPKDVGEKSWCRDCIKGHCGTK